MLEDVFVITNPKTGAEMWIGEEAFRGIKWKGWVKKEKFTIEEASSPEFAKEILETMKGSW